MIRLKRFCFVLKFYFKSKSKLFAIPTSLKMLNSSPRIVTCANIPIRRETQKEQRKIVFIISFVKYYIVYTDLASQSKNISQKVHVHKIVRLLNSSDWETFWVVQRWLWHLLLSLATRTLMCGWQKTVSCLLHVVKSSRTDNSETRFLSKMHFTLPHSFLQDNTFIPSAL